MGQRDYGLDPDMVDRICDEVAAVASSRSHGTEVEFGDTGKMLKETRWQAKYIAEFLHFYGGAADKITGETLPIDKPDMFVFGHVHRPISGVWRGIPFHTVRGFNHQVALQLSDDSVVMLTYESGEENMQNPLLENDRL